MYIKYFSCFVLFCYFIGNDVMSWLFDYVILNIHIYIYIIK